MLLRSTSCLTKLIQITPNLTRRFTTKMSIDAFKLTELSASDIESRYRPYKVASTPDDWVNQLDLSTTKAPTFDINSTQPRILILYGSLRAASKSRLCAFEFARILDRMGADVRVYNPAGLPLKDDSTEKHHKVIELRQLSEWSTAQVWVSPEQHGAITGIMKNLIDQIPLSIGSVRPTQGRVLAVAQVNGGSQSFNAVNTLRLLGRWMRMFTIPNQSSIPIAWKEFVPADEPHGRLRPSNYRDRVVDVAEELFKFAVLLHPHADYLVDRYSEREEVRAKGRLLTQAEKEAEKDKERELVLARQEHTK